MTLNRYYKWALFSLIISFLISLFADALREFIFVGNQDLTALSNAFLYPALVLLGAGWRENRRSKID